MVEFENETAKDEILSRNNIYGKTRMQHGKLGWAKFVVFTCPSFRVQLSSRAIGQGYMYMYVDQFDQVKASVPHTPHLLPVNAHTDHYTSCCTTTCLNSQIRVS